MVWNGMRAQTAKVLGVFSVPTTAKHCLDGNVDLMTINIDCDTHSMGHPILLLLTQVMLMLASMNPRASRYMRAFSSVSIIGS